MCAIGGFSIQMDAANPFGNLVKFFQADIVPSVFNLLGGIAVTEIPYGQRNRRRKEQGKECPDAI